MRRLVVYLLVIFMMSIVVTGCGGGGDKVGGNNSSTGGTIKLDDGKEINYGTAKQGKSLELPADYPVDVLPLLDDAVISFVNTNDSTKGIGVYYETGKSFDEAVAFYEEVMTNADTNMQTNSEGMYMLIGSKDSRSITITISQQPDANVGVLLDTTPSYN